MNLITNSSVPLRYLTSPATNLVVRLEKCPLDPEIQSHLIAACKANKDEVCGFVTDDENIVYVPNSHLEPHYNFFMNNEDISAALDIVNKVYSGNIIGIFHTHHNNIPWPTPEDIAGWPQRTLPWRYWIATNYEVIEWAKLR